ncbi:MAG TPA: hypothetical protein VME69_13140 [Methylocella sp.]|nr:hypothetical protein [Methylocella sp.]
MILLKVWKRIPPFWRYTLTVFLSLFISVFEVWVAVRRNQPEQGERGGAVATIIALVIVFLRPDWGKHNYDMRIKMIPNEASEIARMTAKVDALAAWLEIDTVDHAKQTKALFIATAIGTAFWAFGGLLAAHLIKVFPWIVAVHEQLGH